MEIDISDAESIKFTPAGGNPEYIAKSQIRGVIPFFTFLVPPVPVYNYDLSGATVESLEGIEMNDLVVDLTEYSINDSDDVLDALQTELTDAVVTSPTEWVFKIKPNNGTDVFGDFELDAETIEAEVANDGVSTERNDNRNRYKYPTITKIDIQLVDGTNVKFECQDISNKPTWNDGTQAAVNQAASDINASL